MPKYNLKIKLLSETTFGRGSGQAGVVDQDVQHDEMGCPYWSGRAIKGILVNECADIVDALGGSGAPEAWLNAAEGLFGRPGSFEAGGSRLSIGEAHLPDDLRALLSWQFTRRVQPVLQEEADEQCAKVNRIREEFRKQLLTALTTDRTQTALLEDGSAKLHSLRTQRVLLCGLVFTADLQFKTDPGPFEKGLLVACIKAFRASGSGRNRGRGAVLVQLYEDNQEITQCWFDEYFKKEVPA